MGTVNTPISQLPPATLPLTGSELIPMDQGGITVKGILSAQSAGLAGQSISWTVAQHFTAGATVVGASGQPALTVTANGGVGSSAASFVGNVRVNGSTVGLAILPQNIQNVDYQFDLSDVGKHVYHTVAGANTYTIPKNVDVIFDIGTPITIVLGSASGNVTIALGAGVTLRQAGTANTGPRTLAANALVTLLKVNTDEWLINGVGIT